VHLALYKFYLNANDTENAIKSMKKVVVSTTIEPEAKLKVFNDFVKFVAANPEYETDLVEVTSLVDNDKSEKTLTELAEYYLKSGDKQKALSYYQEALKQDPNSYNLMKDVLLLQVEVNYNTEAVTLSEKALDLYPAQPIFYLINGVANNKINNAKSAISSLETGLDYIIDDPKMESDFYTQLSIAYKSINNITKSNAFAKKAAALNKAE